MLTPVLQNREQFIAEPETTEIIVGAMDTEFQGTFVSMGNPHFVIFVDDISQTDVAKYGAFLEMHPYFPQRCNIEFAQVMDDGTIRTRVWERGSGITMACGTGACATAVAAYLTGRGGRKSRIAMDGGTLDIEWRENDNHIYMTGPAAFSFDGEIDLPNAA
jgi:diaminopimelate epimerase